LPRTADRGSDRSGCCALQRPRQPRSRGRARRRRAAARCDRNVCWVSRATLGSLAGVSLRRSSERPRRLRMKELTRDDATLLELVDRLLNKGVVLTGEATISVAGVDLIYLGLNVVLAAVGNLRNRDGAAPARDHSQT